MDQALSQVQSLVSQVEVITNPAAKYVLPLAGAYLASKALGTFWRRFIGPLLVGEMKWRYDSS